MRLVQKYWNKKLLSLSSSVLLKVLGIQALVSRSMPLGCSMEKDKGYDDMIGYTVVVSVSVSCSRYYKLALS